MSTNTFKRYAAKNVLTTANTIITANAATQTTVIGLSVCNTSQSPITANVYVTSSGVSYYIVQGATVPVGGALTLFGGDGKLVLNSSDTFNVQSSANNSCDAIVSVLEIA
jgi:hypothetical protein